MCVGDKAYCKRKVQNALCAAARSVETMQPDVFRETFLNHAAAWMVMYASAK